MRRVYGEPLRRLFTKELQANLSGFKPKKVTSGFLLAGERAFTRELRNGQVQWIFLLPSAKDDEFTLEVGWSPIDKPPPEPGYFVPETTRQANELREFRCRLGHLVGNQDIWWHIDGYMRAPTAKEILRTMPGAMQSDPTVRVLVCVRASIQSLVTYGVPFLDKATA